VTKKTDGDDGIKFIGSTFFALSPKQVADKRIRQVAPQGCSCCPVAALLPWEGIVLKVG
jgi:hypothetical protein